MIYHRNRLFRIVIFFFLSICIIENRLEGYFLAGLKAILLEKNAELKEMRETKAEIKNDLERGDAALAKVYQKMTEMKELHHFVTNNNHTESEEVPKPRATVSTIKVSFRTYDSPDIYFFSITS